MQGQPTCEAIDIKMIYYSHANKTHFTLSLIALSLVLKMKVLETRIFCLLAVDLVVVVVSRLVVIVVVIYFLSDMYMK